MATFGQDPRLATIASFVESFRQAKALQFQKAFLTRREDRYETQLQENRRVNQRTFGLAQRREGRLQKQFEFEQGKPPQFSARFFEETLNYSPTTAKLLQDRHFGAAAKPRRPIEDIRDARIIMENALSDQEFDVGESMLREAMERLAGQQTDVSDALSPTTFGGGAETPVFAPGTPVSSDLTTGLPQLFTQPEGPPRTSQGTSVFQGPQVSPKTKVTGGFLGRKKSAFPPGFETPEGLEEIFDQLTGDEQETARTYIQSGIAPQVIIDWFKQHGGGFQFPKQN